MTSPTLPKALRGCERPSPRHSTALCFGMLVVLLFLEADGVLGIQRATPWTQMVQKADAYNHLEGIWSDACPCKIPCPCWKTARSCARRCLNVQIFHVDAGGYQSTNLSRTTFVLVSRPTGNYGLPEPLVVYAPSEAPLGDDAISSLFGNVFKLRPLKGIERVPISATLLEGHHKVTIPDVLNYEVEEGKPPAAPETQVREYLYPWLFEAQQWHARRVDYLAENAGRFGGTNSLYSKFRVDFEREEPVNDKASCCR